MTGLRVATFNCAGGNPTCSGAWPELMTTDLYTSALNDPDGPVLALQEVNTAHRHALEAIRTRSAILEAHRPGQGNALIVPTRYEILGTQARRMNRANARALKMAYRDGHDIDWRQILEQRTWIAAELRDTQTGRTLTVFTTHLSGDPWVRIQQAEILLKRISIEPGPVVLLADLNVRKASTHVADQVIRRDLIPPLRDMAPTVHGLDWILGRGGETVSHRIRDDIKGSDHYPLEATIALL